jgi:uncharacterized protein (UPF0333 family)
MKIFLITCLGIALITGGVIGYVYLSQAKTPSSSTTKTQVKPNVTFTGTLSKATDPNGEYTHLLNSTAGVKGVNSYSVHLDDYTGKKVTITGQYSGTTLYADTVIEVQ